MRKILYVALRKTVVEWVVLTQTVLYLTTIKEAFKKTIHCVIISDIL